MCPDTTTTTTTQLLGHYCALHSKLWRGGTLGTVPVLALHHRVCLGSGAQWLRDNIF